MKVSGFLKSTLTALACTGIVLPQPAVFAAPPTQDASQNKSESTTAPKILDVSLDKDGVLHGTIMSVRSIRAVDADVIVKQGKRIVAKTKTNSEGGFSVPKLRGGVYQIEAEKSVASVRVWTNGTAPQKAKSHALLLTGRIQSNQGVIPPADLLSGLVLGGVVASITIGAINMSNIDDIEDRVNQNNAGINAIQNSLN